MIILSFFLLSAVATPLNAQSNPEEVIKAELAFAKFANDQSTRLAFLQNLSPAAVLYEQGKVVNGRELWEKRPEGNSLLAWWPVFADISMDGDLGYTTGPFQFYNAKGDQNPVSTGYYSTIWRKESDGVWRVLTDIGIGLREPGIFTHDVAVADKKGERQTGAVGNELVALEEQYLRKLNVEKKSFDRQFLADQFRIHRNIIGPVTTTSQLEKLDQPALEFAFENEGHGISSSGDLAYTYGNAHVMRKDKPGEVRNQNYVRVWKRLNGQWRIVLDVIGG